MLSSSTSCYFILELQQSKVLVGNEVRITLPFFLQYGGRGQWTAEQRIPVEDKEQRVHQHSDEDESGSDIDEDVRCTLGCVKARA